MGIVHAKPEKPIWAKSTIYHDKNWAHWHTCKSRNQLEWSEMWMRQKTFVLKAGSRRKKMIHLWCGHLPYLANIILRPACPQSLTNRCETQYFDGKKGKCHSATSLRIYDASTYFLKMNRRPFFLKLLQNKLAEERVWCDNFSTLFSLSVLSKHQPTNDYVFTSLALISICGLSPIVRRKLWLNLLWATPRLLVSSFYHLPEEWNCERRGNINL